jgi:molecular chaperone GrpE
MNKMNEETPNKDLENEVELEQKVEEVLDEIDETEENIEELESEIEQKQQSLTEEIGKLKEEIIRMRAEAENVRKRNARELDNLRKYAIDKFCKALLPVADSMDKELEAFDKDGVEMTVEQMIEGTKLTQNVLNKVLNDNGMEIIDPKGEKFNPEFHEAMAQVPNPEVAPNTVVDVFQKGYILNGRLVRPAMVVVSK